MPISIAPTNLLPLGDQPTRISVLISRDFLKSIDPSMDELVEGDSFTRVKRKGKTAINQMARDVSRVIFGAEVSRLPHIFGWPKHIVGLKGPENKPYYYIGICFEQHVTMKDPSPKVLGFTEKEELDGTIVFHAAELDAARSDHINKCVTTEHYGALEISTLDNRDVVGSVL